MIQPETIAGRKEHFRKRREAKNSQWITDENGVVHIPLGRGYEALIDSVDREKAAQLTWRVHLHQSKNPNKKNKPYAEAAVLEELREKYGKTILLHRFLLDSPKGVEVDHKHGDGLDCRRSEMRIATRSQNASNRHYTVGKGLYRGVFVVGRRWGAQLELNGKNRHLGIRGTPEEAALLYNKFAFEAFGEFAILNQIEVQV